MPDLQTLEREESRASWAAREVRFWSMRESAGLEHTERRALMRQIQTSPGRGETDCLGCGVIGKTREAWGLK